MNRRIRSQSYLLGCFLCFLMVGLSGLAADPFRLELLDGKTFEGTLVTLSAEKVELSTLEGPQAFPAAQIRSLKRLANAELNAPNSETAAYNLQLRDGTLLRPNSIELSGKTARIQLGKVDQKISAAEIQWLRFRNTVAANESAWEEIITTESKSDRLVVLRAGDTLDTVEGLVLAMDANEVRFNFDGDEIKAPRNKLLGITFFTSAKKSYTPAKIKVTTRSQDIFAALAIESIRENETDLLKIVTSADIAFQLPLEMIQQLDFSAGNLQLLAELSPLQTATEIESDYPGDLAIADKLFAPHADHYGRTATDNDLPKTDLVFQGAGSIEYRVPEGMGRFQAVITGSPKAQWKGWTVITVQQEDEVLFQQSLRPEIDRLPIDVTVVPKRRITLKVKAENPRQAEDSIWWLQPRFVK